MGVMLHEYTGRACVVHSVAALAAASFGQAGFAGIVNSSRLHRGPYLRPIALLILIDQSSLALPYQITSSSLVSPGLER